MDKKTEKIIDLMNYKIKEFICVEHKKPTIMIINKKLFKETINDWFDCDTKPYYYDGMKIITTKDIDDLLFC